MDERVLAERLITYDTSTSDGLRATVGFVKGWLEASNIPVTGREFGGLPWFSRHRPGDETVRDPARPRRRRAAPPPSAPRIEGDR